MIVDALIELGYRVEVVNAFVEARERLLTDAPRVLVTQVRIGEYNGLHLVLRAKTASPGVAAVVASEASDRVLQREAEELGATFMVLPLPPSEVAAAVARTIAAVGTAEPYVRPPFERRSAERRGIGDAPEGRERRSKVRRRD